MTDAENRALLDALAAEHAAVYAYGVIAAWASPERTRLVSESTAAHRARRDATVDALEAAGVTAPPPDPAYTMPFPIEGSIDAARLAATVENDTAIAWRAVAEQGGTEQTRRTAVEALTESALRLARWRVILGEPTAAFPGKP
ncbi:ferritin-like domain-containing protein [Nocardia puris]|uniref:Uncharacterized protein DUF4439 n=1 Tax=Nocardia puris TaxID=208602 RepID=A0A366E2S6_9NOCA|nr:ferritin-like domain-containing protein [Nocardia puris]MBF6212563.1 ferritin-like domain-containing protein [Nocardia puris]MBF6369143.1 ferritin-like domain-containing protein [Nocardia puris]MBF6463344.1 ferritin-like domain-containing protein [Nocardia puris]RBO96622.1 uncharacterized protein DUF4439 [Nocardia puris]